MTVSGAGAQAAPVKPDHFFDFNYAKSLWLEVETRADMTVLYDCNKNDSGVFDAWNEAYKRSPQSAIEDLESNPRKEVIKRCFDTQLTYKAWSNVYRAWRGPLEVYGGKGWNKTTRAINCMAISLSNIFTGECNDLPDWRHPDNVVEDKSWLAVGNARWTNRN